LSRPLFGLIQRRSLPVMRRARPSRRVRRILAAMSAFMPHRSAFRMLSAESLASPDTIVISGATQRLGQRVPSRVETIGPETPLF